MSRIYKGHSKLNNKKINKPITKWAKDMNRRVTKKDKERSTLALREPQTNAMMRDHRTPTVTANIKNTANTKCWQEHDAAAPLTVATGM